MFSFIEVLRALATLLVANSHFKGVYPSDVLSFGGGFGLALFFMISGYLLANIKKDTDFCKWFFPKIVRLYIPLYIVRIIELLVGYQKPISLQAFLLGYVFPGMWFSGAMILLYVLYFALVKYWLKGEVDRRYRGVMVFLTMCYCALFIIKPGIATFSIQTLQMERTFSIETPYFITQFVWLSCMLIGYWIRKTDAKMKKAYLQVGILIASVLAFLAVRLITRNGQNMNTEIILGPIYIGFAFSMFTLIANVEPWCRKVIQTRVGWLITVISTCSLEIYYIQFMWIEMLRDLWFPVNLLLLCMTIMVTAFAVHWISQKFLKKISASNAVRQEKS